jgi:pyruvate dehydrogenase E1 component alpha subunit
MHLIDLGAGFLGSVPIVGATVPLAVGAAWAAKLRGENKIIAVFFGDGTFEEGAVYESINFAVLHRLPILFVCENNLYSCYTPLTARQPERPIHGVAASCGCKTIAVDGNDVLAVLDAASVAVGGLRAGGQPVFMECSTYRWREHCGPNVDDHLGYRPAAEVAQWKAACPVNRLATILKATPEGTSFLNTVEHEIAEEINDTFILAQAGSNPQSSDLPGYLYAQ